MTIGQRNNKSRRQRETKRQKQATKNVYFQNEALKRILTDEKSYVSESDFPVQNINYTNHQSHGFIGYAASYLRNIFFHF